MAKNAILFIDLLGVQKMWSEGGATAVATRIREFNDFVIEQAEYLPSELHRDGEYTVILSGDSVSVMCQDFDQAIGIGQHLFTQAFYASDRVSSPFWLRGAIGTWGNQHLTVKTVPIHAKRIQVGTRYEMEPEYLSVVALEKSGFRGMRLIVNPELLEGSGSGHVRTWLNFIRPLHLVTKLTECNYPAYGEYVDVLWMADTQERYKHLKGIMASRFKKSARDPDEFVQASWTRVAFDQVDSLIWACENA